MDQTLRYWRDLYALLRSARHNPLVMHASVWRAGWVGVAFAVIQLLAGAGALLGSISLVSVVMAQEFYSLSSFPGIGRIDEQSLLIFGFLSLIFGGLAGSIVLYPLNLLAFATRWSDPQRLEDLVMTRLAPREMAFGSIFWGIAAGSIVPAAAVLSAIVCLIGYVFVEIHGREWSSLWDDDTFAILCVLILICETIPSAAGATLRIWFHLVRRKWPIIFLGPAYCAAHVYMTGVAIFFAGEVLDRAISGSWDNGAAGLCVLAIGTTVSILTLRSAGKFAPSLFLYAVLPESYALSSVVADSARRLRDRGLRQLLNKSLRASIPRSLLVQLGAYLAMVLVFALASRMLRPADFTGVWLNAYVLLAALPFATAIILAHEARKNGNTLAFVSGSVDGSLLRRLWPLHLFAILAALSVWSSSYPMLFGGSLIHLLLSIVAVALFLAAMFLGTLIANAVAVAWWLAAGRMRGARFVLYLLFPVLIWLVVAIAIRRNPEYYGWDIWTTRSQGASALLVLGGLVLLHRSLANLQRLFDCTVRGTPPGTVARLNPWTGCATLEPPNPP